MRTQAGRDEKGAGTVREEPDQPVPLPRQGGRRIPLRPQDLLFRLQADQGERAAARIGQIKFTNSPNAFPAICLGKRESLNTQPSNLVKNDACLLATLTGFSIVNNENGVISISTIVNKL